MDRCNAAGQLVWVVGERAGSGIAQQQELGDISCAKQRV